MPQLILPLIPTGATQINDLVSVQRDKYRWTYFLATHPIYSHAPGDQPMFRVVISQLIDSGTCRQVDIINAFGISKSLVARTLRKFREEGPEGFFKKRKGGKKGSVLTEEVLGQAQALIDQGYARNVIAEELVVKPDTLRKAISDGRLQLPKHKDAVLTKSERNEIDAEAAFGMGTACTRVGERILASVGMCAGAAVQFEMCFDVPNGGVLCALPALMANGLLDGAEQILGQVRGYYTQAHILLLIAFMALCRIKTTEQIRGQAPGEFGKLLGLDRIPEVRCLRNKLDALSVGDSAELWAAHLSGHWMKKDPDAVGTLYIDGHVRVYHGHLIKLPRRYVSRERLCLRGTTDYWVNDAIGRPFFVVEKVVDPGLLQTLRTDIVPRLLVEIPNQPTDTELSENPLLARFILVFDREGYSPAFFAEMWRDHRIGCMTYHKHAKGPWPEEWFGKHHAVMPRGETVAMELCEMGSHIGSGKDKVWVREVRKLTASGHQTSIISTAFDMDLTEIATRMFSRWCQENFFRYMMQHFDIDRVIEYGAMPFPDTEQVINPVWRELNRQRNAIQNKLRYRRAKFAELSMHPAAEEEPKIYEKWLGKKAELFEEIGNYEKQSENLKAELKNTEKHIRLDEMDEEEQFLRLLPGRKRLLDTIRMIAYRAETAMVGILRSSTVDSSEARKLLQDLFVTEADLIPDQTQNQLVVRVHNASRPAANRSLARLLDHLNEAELKYPGTNLHLVYRLGRENGKIDGNGVT